MIKCTESGKGLLFEHLHMGESHLRLFTAPLHGKISNFLIELYETVQ